MARRRGFFAELQRQAAAADRDRQRSRLAAERDAERRQRATEKAYAAAERARTAAARADSRSRAAADREAKRMYAEARQAEVESLNGDLTTALADIDGVLKWTLEIDDHVDLELLRQVPDHPPFASRHQEPIPPPVPVGSPAEPVYSEPLAPGGIGGLFKRKEHAEAVARQRATFEKRHREWQAHTATIPVRQQRQAEKHAADEAERQMRLAADLSVYEAECRRRTEQAAADNADLDDLIRRYSAGDTDAVEEYCGIVFSNSVYPDTVSLGIGIEYQRDDRELTIELRLPRPGELPSAKSYRYVKAKDEVVETPQAAREQRDRFNNLVYNIVLRTTHEMWEADRARHFDTIALTAGVEHTSPATGRPTVTPLLALACDRDTFDNIDLAKITPAETLKHLSAAVSKNPHGLVAISNTPGVRG